MAYTTYTIVGQEFKNLTFSSSTNPTDSIVTRMITESDAYINGRLEALYETPITGATSLLIVQQISTFLVAARVREIMQVKTGSDVVFQQARSGDLYKMAMDMLDQLVSRKLLLPDATLLSSATIWQSESTEDPDDNDVETFEFQKQDDAW